MIRLPVSGLDVEHTLLTVLAAWQDALDAFPAEMLRSLRALKTQIRDFIASRLA